MVDMKRVVKYATFGALATAATPYLLQLLSKGLSIVPGAAVNLQSVVSVETTGLGGVINTGLAAKLMGLIPNIPFTVPTFIMTVIGGALAVGLGGLVIEVTNGGLLKNLLKFDNSFSRILEALTYGSILAGMAIAGSLAIPAWQAIGALVLNSAILSGIYVGLVQPLLKMAKLDIMP